MTHVMTYYRIQMGILTLLDALSIKNENKGFFYKSARRDSIPGPLGIVVADIAKGSAAVSALARAATMPPTENKGSAIWSRGNTDDSHD